MSFLQEWMGFNPAEYNHWEVRWDLAQAEVFLVLLALMVPLALWFAWTSLARITSSPKKIFLFALRTLALALITLILFQPQLDFKKSRLLKNTIAVLLDDSKSLSIKTYPDELTRADIIKNTLAENRDYLESLGKDFQVDTYFVSDHLDPVPQTDLSARYEPRRPNTDFSQIFTQLRRKYEGKPLQGVLLFTDGADLTQEAGAISPDLLSLLAGLDAPVHTLQAGSNSMFKDLAISRVEAPDFGFIHQPVHIAATVNAASMGNKNVSLVLRDGKNILATQIIELREGVTEYQVELEFTPTELKRGVYSLTLPLFAGESIAVNNRRDFMVKIVRDRIRVLHLNGRPSWDSRFLREVLVNNPKVDLLSFFILRTLGDDVASPTSELSLIPFPTNLLFSDYLNSFDLIVFQNFRYEPFVDRKYLSNIKEFVENGGAFMMVGGDLSFQSGGYEQTPIEEILPVRMQRQASPFSQKAYHLKLRGTAHPILRLEKDNAANEKIWESLPELNGINTGLTLGEGGLALADDGSGKETGNPVLVAGRKGKGHVLALATDSSWNWNFRRVGEGGSGRYHHKFWNNAIAWLTGEPETGLVQLETDKERYREGEEVLIKLKVFNEDYSPAAHKTANLVLQSLSGEPQTHALETDDNGEVSHQFFPGGEGFYNVQVEVQNKDEKLVEETRFGVFSDTLEFQKPLVNESLLKRMAEATNGKYTVLGKNTLLSDLPFANPEIFEQSQSKTLSLWDNWWAYTLIVSLLLTDWFIRRKSGLS